MCIVTVSRGSYSGAKAIAEGVARGLDVPCVSREVIADAACAAGVSARALDEALTRPPSFFERLSRERDAYMRFLKAALFQRAARGGFVYHGMGGHFMLAGLPNLLRLRVIAPLRHRVEAVQADLGLDKHQARRHVEAMDQRRAKWVRFLYGADWTDPSLYDLVINLERIGIESAVESILRLARSQRFVDSEERNREAADLALAHCVTAELTKLPEARTVGLSVRAERGRVVLRGTTQYDDLRRAIVAAVEGVPGVEDVLCEIHLRSDVLRS